MLYNNCCVQYQFNMNNFQEDDDYKKWKARLEMAKEGNNEVLEQIKAAIGTNIPQQHPILNYNLKNLLQESKLLSISKEQTFGSYELYSNVATYILLKGCVFIQCINTEGDNETLCRVQKNGILQIIVDSLKTKYGESNIKMLTQFQIVGEEPSLLIQLSERSMKTMKKIRQREIVTVRQQAIMRKYMLLALKHITKVVYTKEKPVNDKFYLLQGRICFYNKHTKHILTCYEEGYFNPKHLASTDYKMHIFEDSFLMILQEEMIKDQTAFGVQLKRQQHMTSIQEKYQALNVEEVSKIQQKLIDKFKLNMRQVEKEIYGIEKVAVDKRIKTKNDFIQTSSSMKDKCGIRIRKTKKVI